MKSNIVSCISIIPLNGRYFIVEGESTIDGSLEGIIDIAKEIGSPPYYPEANVLSVVAKALAGMRDKAANPAPEIPLTEG